MIDLQGNQSCYKKRKELNEYDYNQTVIIMGYKWENVSLCAPTVRSASLLGLIADHFIYLLDLAGWI